MTYDELSSLPEGKLKISVTTRSAGRKFDKQEGQTQSCLITFCDFSIDTTVRKEFGVAGLRRHKLLRITGEAYEQSVELNQELVSFDILGCGLRTLQRDIALLASYGVYVPFQRSVALGGRRFTYKVAAAQMYLEGHTRDHIAACLFQDATTIGQLIQDFARFVRLANSGINTEQIQTVMNRPNILIEEFWRLFKDYNTPQYFKRLDLFAQTAK